VSVQRHAVYVLDMSGKPLTPTTPAKARKLLKAGAAKKVWSKFQTFGIQLLTETRQARPITSLGVDPGTKFEGYAVICGTENALAVKLDLPDKQNIAAKLKKRRSLRRARRFRKCRRRPARFANRSRKGFIAPSQLVIVCSRLKVLRALFALYPITRVGLEDLRFNHAKHRWGANFSTVEIGKKQLKEFLEAQGAQVSLFQGFETKALREKYGYSKSKLKGADCFTAHCSDALALACVMGSGVPVAPGSFIIVDDTYRPVRRKLHDEQPAKGGIRETYSRGTVFGVQKGRLIGSRNGKIGQLCGEKQGRYRYYDQEGKRQETVRIVWISSQFVVRKEAVKHSARS
jgi:hypothetical protein